MKLSLIVHLCLFVLVSNPNKVNDLSCFIFFHFVIVAHVLSLSLYFCYLSLLSTFMYMYIPFPHYLQNILYSYNSNHSAIICILTWLLFYYFYKYTVNSVIKIKFKHWWSTILPISIIFNTYCLAIVLRLL